jgi:hypothetical protein
VTDITVNAGAERVAGGVAEVVSAELTVDSGGMAVRARGGLFDLTVGRVTFGIERWNDAGPNEAAIALGAIPKGRAGKPAPSGSVALVLVIERERASTIQILNSSVRRSGPVR